MIQKKRARGRRGVKMEGVWGRDEVYTLQQLIHKIKPILSPQLVAESNYWNKAMVARQKVVLDKFDKSLAQLIKLWYDAEDN